VGDSVDDEWVAPAPEDAAALERIVSLAALGGRADLLALAWGRPRPRPAIVRHRPPPPAPALAPASVSVTAPAPVPVPVHDPEPALGAAAPEELPRARELLRVLKTLHARGHVDAVTKAALKQVLWGHADHPLRDAGLAALARCRRTKDYYVCAHALGGLLRTQELALCHDVVDALADAARGQGEPDDDDGMMPNGHGLDPEALQDLRRLVRAGARPLWLADDHHDQADPPSPSSVTLADVRMGLARGTYATQQECFDDLDRYLGAAAATADDTAATLYI
jgi:hypothetical protein